jgi:hypothetical protein
MFLIDFESDASQLSTLYLVPKAQDEQQSFIIKEVFSVKYIVYWMSEIHISHCTVVLRVHSINIIQIILNLFSWLKVSLIFILLQSCTSLHCFIIKCWHNNCIYKVLTYSHNTDFYFVQLTFGISKCSVRLSRCLLNSSTLCLCVIAAFCLIRSFCWKKKIGNWENGHQINEHMPLHSQNYQNIAITVVSMPLYYASYIVKKVLIT